MMNNLFTGVILELFFKITKPMPWIVRLTTGPCHYPRKYTINA